MPQITEAAPLTTEPTGNRWRARIIEGDIWGSSGFYPKTVLESDGPTTWPAGTAIFFDHPSESERYDRPERSVKDLAGRISTTPAYESDGLYAEVEFYSWAAPVVKEMAGDIGLSIRASAEAEQGEAAGRRGPIITKLHEGLSVDLVTKAGAGGKLVSLLESARSAHQSKVVTVPVTTAPTTSTFAARHIVERAVAHGVTEATANDTQQALSDALRSAYGGDQSYVWVRDFDPEAGVVWYEIESGDSPGIWQEGYTLDDQEMPTLSGNRFEVVQRTEYVPVTADSTTTAAEAATDVPVPAGQPNTPPPPSEEDTMGTIQVDEAEHRRVTEAAGRVQTLESERDTARQERDQSRSELSAFRAREAVRPVVARRVAESGLPARRQARIVEAVITGAVVDDQGHIDADAVVAATQADVEEAQAEIAEIAESLGVGAVRGFGHANTTGSTVTEADAARAVAAAFGRTIEEG